MAEYIPPGIERIPTMVTVEIQVTFPLVGEKAEAWYATFLSSVTTAEKVDLYGYRMIVRSMDRTTEPWGASISVTLVGYGTAKGLQIERIQNKLRWELKGSQVAVNTNIDYQEFSHQGYVRHDFKKQDCLDEKKRVYVETLDILRDSEDNLFTTTVYYTDSYWCGDCNDERDKNNIIAVVKSPTKHQALKAHKHFVKTWRVKDAKTTKPKARPGSPASGSRAGGGDQPKTSRKGKPR